MQRERRKERRYVVDGLRAELDGVVHDILDLSASGIRLVRLQVPVPSARLRLVAVEGSDPLDVTVAARFQRATGRAVVYRYDPPAADWAARLATYDVFADLGLAPLDADHGPA